MKAPKQSNRNPDGKKRAPGTHERAYRVCILDGKAQRVYAVGGKGYVLPDGARWATEADARHGEVAKAMSARAKRASMR